MDKSLSTMTINCELLLGALAVSLQSRGPNQHIVQFSGPNTETLMYGPDVEFCESAAGVVCQGRSKGSRITGTTL